MVLSSNSRPPDRGERGTGQGTIGSVTKGKEMGDVFILGSGFSKAIHSAMPTLDELSQEVITRLRQLPYPIESPLNELDENIELWITYLSQRQPWLPDSENDYNGALARRIREQIFDVIEERTSIASEKEPPSWVGKLIRSWHHERATIVTLNYDTLIERVAKETKISEKEVRILSSQIYPPYFADVQARSGGSLWGEGDLRTFSLLKLHGSINWYYSGRAEFFGETILFSEDPPRGNTLWESGRFRRQQSRDKEPLIIPPILEKTTYFNNETVRRLWYEAGKALQDATRVFIIGYSLPSSDMGMKFFLKTHLRGETVSVYVIDVDSKITEHYLKELNLEVIPEFIDEGNAVEHFAQSYPNISD